MNNLKNIAIMAIISLMFVAKTSVAQVSDSARVAKAQALADSLYWDSYEFQLTSYYEYKKDSILDVLTMSNNLSKRERLLLQGELKGIENAQALLDTHAQIQIANGNAQIVKAEQTANTIVCVEQGKCDVATAKAGSFVAQEEDKTSYYTNKTNMRNSMGDLKKN